MNRKFVPVITIGSISLLTACGTTTKSTSLSINKTTQHNSATPTVSSPSPSPSPSTGAGDQIQGYLADFSNAVQFFSPFVNGTSEFYEAYNQGGNSPQVVSQSSPITVNQSGSNVELTFQNMSFGPNQQQQLTGTLSNGQLVIMFPQSDGSLSSETFQSGTVAQYNSDVQQLKQQVNGQQQAIAQQNQIKKEQSTISDDAQTVFGDLQGIQSYQNTIANDFSNMSDALQQEKSALTVTLKQLQSEETLAQQYPNGDDGNISYQAGEVSYDEGTVSYDQGTVQYYDPSSTISNLADLANQLRSDFSTYQNDQAQLPNYAPSAVPTSAIVQNAVNQINADLTQDKSTLSQYLTSAQQLVNQANDYVNTANQVASTH